MKGDPKLVDDVSAPFGLTAQRLCSKLPQACTQTHHDNHAGAQLFNLPRLNHWFDQV
jgi:hypothetical protein